MTYTRIVMWPRSLGSTQFFSPRLTVLDLWALPKPLTYMKGREPIYYLTQMTYEDDRQWSNGSRFVENFHVQLLGLIDDLYESAYIEAQYELRLEPFLDQVEALRTYPMPYLTGLTSLKLQDCFNENVIELELDELGHWVLYLRFYIRDRHYLVFNLYWREPSSID